MSEHQVFGQPEKILFKILHTLLFCVTGVLYLVGGWNSKHVYVNTVSGYQITSAGNLEEVPVAPMNSARQYPGATATRTGLIVCGGCAGGSILKTCEAYHQKTNR